MVCWNAVLCSPEDVYHHFGTTCCVKGRQEVLQNARTYLLDHYVPHARTPESDYPPAWELQMLNCIVLVVFEGGLSQHLAAYSEGERDAWLQAIQLASYDCMRSQLLALQQRMELHRGQDPDLDVEMWRIRRGHTVGMSFVLRGM